MTEKKRRQWNACEKIAIIMYHENGHSKRKTADKFNIQAKQLCDWISKKPQLLKVQPGVKYLNIEVKPKYPALETALTLAQQRQWQVMCSGIRSFRFSNKWLDSFMSRNKLSNRYRTTIAQRLPEDLIEKQQSFLAFVMYRHIQHDYPLIENVWVKREKLSNPQSLLVLDSFSAYIVDSVKRHFIEKKTDIAVIPGGYNEWMAETIKDLTPTGIIKRPTYETVAHWVKDSWEAVDVNLIWRSFKCYSISNNRDGTKDGWIFNYDRLEQQASKPNDEVAPLSDKEDENTSDEGYETDTSEEEHGTDRSDKEFGNNESDEESENDESDEEHGNEEDKSDESEYEGVEDDGYLSYYDEQKTNYVNVWDE
ncbi:unnamed protein product [Rhizophagus irregularis]|nr:unnamed protein product [Rhizophagus irregularis]